MCVRVRQCVFWKSIIYSYGDRGQKLIRQRKMCFVYVVNHCFFFFNLTILAGGVVGVIAVVADLRAAVAGSLLRLLQFSFFHISLTVA